MKGYGNSSCGWDGRSNFRFYWYMVDFWQGAISLKQFLNLAKKFGESFCIIFFTRWISFNLTLESSPNICVHLLLETIKTKLMFLPQWLILLSHDQNLASNACSKFCFSWFEFWFLFEHLVYWLRHCINLGSWVHFVNDISPIFFKFYCPILVYSNWMHFVNSSECVVCIFVVNGANENKLFYAGQFPLLWVPLQNLHFRITRAEELFGGLGCLCRELDAE